MSPNDFNSILMYCTLTEEGYDYAKKLTAVISDLYKVCIIHQPRYFKMFVANILERKLSLA